MVAFGVVSLTVVRIVPVAIALLGTGMQPRSVSYIGWFGPRGLASLVFAGTVVVETGPGMAPFIIAAVSTVVAMSIVLHGMTAVPWSRTYSAWYNRHADKGVEMSESMTVEHIPNRRRLQVEPKRR
jgi:NhaP-type Na+/H+ or K+/H+ antiporter